MPSLRYPYNYCEGDDAATTWAIATEHEMRLRKFQHRSLATSAHLATVALRRLAVAIGGTK